MATMKVLRDEVRSMFVGRVREFFAEAGEEVLVTGTNEIAMPVVDTEGNEMWVQVVVKVPTGGRDGEGYDGYSMAEDYAMKMAEKSAKAEEAARKKAIKMEKDKAAREAKAAAKAAK